MPARMFLGRADETDSVPVVLDVDVVGCARLAEARTDTIEFARSGDVARRGTATISAPSSSSLRLAPLTFDGVTPTSTPAVMVRRD
jgi:hypothetical protein